MARKIRKAILPVAGLGTRFLPATKAVPKEMLTVVDRPVVQHVVDEARAAGIEHIVFVTGRNKGVIEDHFDRQYELEDTLKERGKTKMLEMLRHETMGPGATSFTRQQLPLGLGHAVWCARDIIGHEPFALLLPDMLHKPRNGTGCLAQMVEAYAKTDGGNHIAVYEVPAEQTEQYGIVALGEEMAEGVHKIGGMVEKPKKDVAPSNLAISGRYILQPEIFDLLATQERGAGNEIQLTDSMLKLAQSQDFFSVTFDGAIYDCGSKLGFLMANVAYALDNPEISDSFRPELDALLAKS
ncbi:UTP--glucose-1-phosphate uridylyltransferase [Ancylobacter pratisalsi]|uniref:UTP--glucose-1-phosphate uridylyltransferase n=1 Tax=Ancylobacter pratisalsi TaxID=1745854 RepID=A0A6P1YIQ8_9HYPH|nr:UTP--glucose-1-phosphate uridylyltransferase [Ancylobacter pratisalsi]QIB33199.1 UTP--glucose-1-phosphate uridylyltransferase [Ancylobacter pratisalsi]